ncbi:cholesterol esterase [Streptomyces griseocarneus]|nr:cholesterol esterase [Streptomyces griseocarneus]
MQSQTRGGTRWRRFAVVMVPSLAATAAIGVAVAQGALAASFSVSGQQFQVTAQKIHGAGFVQYGALDQTKAGGKPVAVVGINKAEITGLCQAVTVPTGLGFDLSMKLTAGGGDKQVNAEKLYIDAEAMDADATFKNVDIGVSVDNTTKGPGPAAEGKDRSGAHVPGSFAQQAEEVWFENVDQKAWATSAGTFTLPGLHMSVGTGAAKCPGK